MHTEISVIIPTYRRPALLRRALKSVRKAAETAQLGCRAMEIIVIDDGHCIASEEVCEAENNIQPYPIIYMRTSSGPGAGPAKARNQGILSAVGNFIFLLDDDDQFMVHRFDGSLPLLRSGRYDAVFERSLKVYEDPRNLPHVMGPAEQITVDPFTYIISGDEDTAVATGATSFTKRIFMKVGGYDESLQMGEDGELLLRVCAAGRVALRAADPVIQVNIHGYNTSRPDRIEYWQNIKALRHLYRNLTKMGALTEVALVQRFISGKLDFVLTRIRAEEKYYFGRLKSGITALFYYPVDCLTLKNLKSIYVFLVRA